MGPMLGWFSLAGLIIATLMLLLVRGVFAGKGDDSMTEGEMDLDTFQEATHGFDE
jgi:hypothetical protein